MGISNQVELSKLKSAIAASQNHLLSIQHPEGYWWAELESNVSITSEVVLLHKIWGTDAVRPLHKVEAYLRSQQRAHGGWELFYDDGGELSVSVEAYMALKLLGVPETDPAMEQARDFILKRGGVSRTRSSTRATSRSGARSASDPPYPRRAGRGPARRRASLSKRPVSCSSISFYW